VTHGQGTRITTADAARLAGVEPDTIHKWHERGHLKPAGRRGRVVLWWSDDVLDVEVATHRRDRSGRAER